MTGAQDAQDYIVGVDRLVVDQRRSRREMDFGINQGKPFAAVSWGFLLLRVDITTDIAAIQVAPSFPGHIGVLIQLAMAVAPLSHSARDYVRAFDLVSVCRWRDGRLGVSRNPKGAEQAWWCPAKDAGALVRAANAGGRDVAAAAARLKTPLTDHAVVAQRNEAAVGQIDASLAAAQRRGDLAFFNQAYKLDARPPPLKDTAL
jgi:hypothetical protein